MRAFLNRSVARLNEMQQAMLVRLEAGQVPPKYRDRMWREYASGRYYCDGVAMDIPNDTGEMVAYQPSESDIATRAWYVASLRNFGPPYRFTTYALLFVAVDVILGLSTPISKRSPYWPNGDAPANNPLQPPAGGGCGVG